MNSIQFYKYLPTDAYKHIVFRKGLSIYVMLHFDFSDDDTCVASTRSDSAVLTIHTRKPSPIIVRIPQRTDLASIALEVNGDPYPLKMYDCFAYNRKA